MELHALPVNRRAVAVNRALEQVVNRAVRARDAVRARLRLGGRAADYDDLRYEFVGGPNDEMRRRHYDKSLRLLWKAEAAAPWSTFRDLTDAERGVRDMAEQAMTDSDRTVRARITSAEFRALLDRTYTLRQKEAIVAILAAIGHGEAYAWLVSASNLRDVRSSGAKAAVTMQVLEEAKHFVVLRELIGAFGVPMPRQTGWEYLLLEGILKARGLEKFFGMNVLVETIALSIFGALAHLPGLDVLRLFHLDESRHTALPQSYFKEFPMTPGQQRGALARVRRLRMALPVFPLIVLMEEDLAVLGIDVFEFAGSILRKVVHLSERAGFYLPRPAEELSGRFNALFNAYCRLTRPGHQPRDFMTADTSRDAEVARVEREVFVGGAGERARA